MIPVVRHVLRLWTMEVSRPRLGRILACPLTSLIGSFPYLPYLYTTNWITEVTDWEDHEPMTSPLTVPGNCMGLIEDEQDYSSEACLISLGNRTEPSTPGSNPGLPSGKLNHFVSAFTLTLHYKLHHCGDRWRRSCANDISTN